jgi:anaerobic magnesium-protoporphyrin IX monomethyl ester cyclase
MKNNKKRRKILLLSPPSSRTVLRGNYCSNESKASYYWPPCDLLILSAILNSHHDLHVIDAIAENLGEQETREQIDNYNPEIIIFMTGKISEREDMLFLMDLKKERPKTVLIGSGDMLLFAPIENLERYLFIDAILMDYASKDVIAYIDGHLSELEQIIYRVDGEIISPWRPGKGVKHYGDHRERRDSKIGIPRHDLFPIKKYRTAIGQRFPFTVTMLTFGCAYICSFCPMEKLLFRYRDLSEVMEEMRFIQSQGIREVLFYDQTFASKREYFLEFCHRMFEEKIDLTWTCETRVDVMDEEILTWMKKAGCHTINFGVETADEVMLNSQKKEILNSQYSKVFSMCDNLGIKTLGHFIVGLPGENQKTIERTLQFAIELDCDYASFNIAEAPLGTSLREESLKKGWIQEDSEAQSSFLANVYPVSGNNSFKEIVRWRNELVRRFYLRPSYILKRLTGVQSWYEAVVLVREGISLLRSIYSSELDECKTKNKN